MHRLDLPRVVRFLSSAVLAALPVSALPGEAPGAEEWSLPAISVRPATAHPVVAATPEELSRLRRALASSGPERQVVARRIRSADAFLERTPRYPPRGGQHNQWYQCDRCQIALRTVDETHHRCPRCEKVYTGEPYDDVVFSRIHGTNLRGAVDAAWAYVITGEAKYASRAREVLLAYAERYRDYPYHSANRSRPPSRSGGYLYEQTLTEASSLTRTIAPAYDLIHDSDLLSAEDHRAIREGLIAPMLENIAKHRAGKSNWQTWHDAAMLWGGAAIGEASWVERAIADPRNGFGYQMRVSVSSEGMWYENSWGYHFYTLSALIEIVEGARRLGIDLWSCPTLQRMFRLPVEYAMPDGSLPRFGDDVQTTVHRASASLEHLYHATRDPGLLPSLPSSPGWTSILLGREVGERPSPAAPRSRVFHGAGHAILRTGDLAAAMTFGPYGGFHGHLDKLSFVFFGRGEELGVDPGRARSQAYRLPIHREWYKATIGHNAVLVDGAPQKPAAGRLERFDATDGHALAAASCDEAYPGVRHARLLVLLPDHLVVVDDLRSKEPHRFTWIYHNRGTGVRSEAAAEAGELPEGLAGRRYIEDVRVGASDRLVTALFAGRVVDVRLLLAPGEATRVATGHGVGASVEDRVPLVLATREGPEVVFAAVLEPRGKGEPPSAESIAARRTGGGLRVELRLASGRTRSIVWSEDGVSVEGAP